MISLLVYDDHRERRESLEELFSYQSDILCVGSFSNCDNLAKEIQELEPDVVLMDIRMTGISGIEATTEIKKIRPQTKVIMQTAYDDDENVFNSLKAGAEGYLLKSASSEKIIQSIIDVYEGGAVITPSIALKITRFFSLHTAEPLQTSDLTTREKEVLHELAQGLSYKMVAAKLGITYHTVNTHIKKIYEKLSVNSVGEAVSMAIRNKLV